MTSGSQREKSKSKSKGAKCQHYGKTGHWRKDCRSLSGEGNKTNQSANGATEVQDALMMREDVSNE